MEEKKCQGCGKMFPVEELKTVQFKSCCSVQNIPLCSDCWAEYYGKKKK